VLELEPDAVGGSANEVEELVATELEVLLVDAAASVLEKLVGTELELLLVDAAASALEELVDTELELLLVDVGAAGEPASTNGSAVAEVELAAAKLLVDAAAEDELESGPTQE